MTQAATVNPFAVLRTRQYVVLLVFALSVSPARTRSTTGGPP